MTVSRSTFHQQYAVQARAKALELFAQKPALKGAWLSWVAGQLYASGPAEYASMVRRELEQLQAQAQTGSRTPE
ncbi:MULTISPECIES: hypothetical protein [Pseudomonas]|uniref:Uncharacterized protein n=1 Tax=Pseudomonas weihenstephanensis TaxID=1608994 RepID=A0ABS1ZKY0_9PSED|nr:MULTISPECIES: hypothetical protein [unclassified Pseudomonas]KVV07851.1 hypothetical protein AP060_01074 [Pseudomonas sp. TAD18]KVV09180.1 hypothetical protein AP059_01004 [Pseudomonas sp. TAA207]MBM1197105.1 hypothetical protein [Pseudomonas weihenstephanensis]